MDESRYTGARVMSHMQMSRVARTNESCLTVDGVESRDEVTRAT